MKIAQNREIFKQDITTILNDLTRSEIYRAVPIVLDGEA